MTPASEGPEENVVRVVGGAVDVVNVVVCVDFVVVMVGGVVDVVNGVVRVDFVVVMVDVVNVVVGVVAVAGVDVFFVVVFGFCC